MVISSYFSHQKVRHSAEKSHGFSGMKGGILVSICVTVLFLKASNLAALIPPEVTNKLRKGHKNPDNPKKKQRKSEM